MLLIPSAQRVPEKSEAGLLDFDILPPISLYVHVPWCIRKCPYCDFYSHAILTPIPEELFLAAMHKDLDSSLSLVRGRQISTVYIGGGTPSILSAQCIKKLMHGIRERLLIAPNAEITIEANPGTFDREKVQAYREAGINRLSLGIQTFSQKHLEFLNRMHDAEQANDAITTAREYFDNINFDFMYGLPDQTMDDLERDLNLAVSYAPEHLSFYHFSIEPDTEFERAPPELPDDDSVADMQDRVEAALAIAGYEKYEVSAFAKPGHQCRHNVNYWQFGDYLSIGAGSHSKLTGDGKVVRQTRYADPVEYMQQALKGNAVDQQHALTNEDLAFEFMLNALRLKKGFYPEMFEERTALSLEAIYPCLKKAEKGGLLYRDPTIIRPTEKGMQFLSDLKLMFLPE